METKHGHFSYCSNIHPGEIWHEHFAELQKNVPLVKAEIAPNEKMGLGLRFANQASIDLQDPVEFKNLKDWLQKENLYVFTLNGFPNVCAIIIAFVFDVTFSSTDLRSIHQVFGSMSAKIGVAPTYLTALAVATQVTSGTITSSPGPMPRASNER
jgi:hypothetical protein